MRWVSLAENWPAGFFLYGPRLVARAVLPCVRSHASGWKRAGNGAETARKPAAVRVPYRSIPSSCSRRLRSVLRFSYSGCNGRWAESSHLKTSSFFYSPRRHLDFSTFLPFPTTPLLFLPCSHPIYLGAGCLGFVSLNVSLELCVLCLESFHHDLH